MIRKLRWKITGVTLLVVAMVLLAVFAGVYLFSRANIAQNYEHQLRQAVQGGAADARLPFLVAEVPLGSTSATKQGTRASDVPETTACRSWYS